MTGKIVSDIAVSFSFSKISIQLVFVIFIGFCYGIIDFPEQQIHQYHH